MQLKLRFFIFAIITIQFFLLSGFNPVFPTDIELSKQDGRSLEIPGLISIAGSQTHLYALSENDGLIVFRAYEDSLQWLYSSEGIQRRGTNLQADVRFAYLTGNDNRLTILEPTSVLGVYSSTELPSKPGPMSRIEDYLYLGLQSSGLYKLPLHTPDAVDSRPLRIHEAVIGNTRITSMASVGRQLFAIDDEHFIHQFRLEGTDLTHIRSFELKAPAERIFIIDGAIILSDKQGTIYEMSGRGELFRLFSIGSSVDQILKVDDVFIIRTADGQVLGGEKNNRMRTLRNDKRAQNRIATAKNTLWLSEYNLVSPVNISEKTSESISNDKPTATAPEGSFSLKPIPNQIIPFSRTLLLPIEMNGDIPLQSVQFQITSSASTSASIRDQGFLWQPGSRDIGENSFTIIASSMSGQVDSTSFIVDVRSFNAPPRFNPVRPLSIPAGERFELPVRATDPDGSDPSLVRYLGVNLPDGATLNERSGLIRWTPNRRQVGKHDFQVIATDQYGSAASLTVTITVMELTR